MFKGLVISPTVNCSLLPFWLGINIEEYGCQGLGHHGIKFCLGKRYIEADDKIKTIRDVEKAVLEYYAEGVS